MRLESELVSVRGLQGGAWLGRLAMLALWLAGAAIVGGAGDLDATTRGCWAPLGLLVGTSILLAVRHGAFAGSARDLSPGSLAIAGGTIEVEVHGRRRAFPVADVVSGWSEPEATRGVETTVLVTRDGTEVRFACSHPDDTARLLRAAGVAADQRAVRIRVRPGLSAARRAVAIFVTFVAGLLALACFVVTLGALFASFRAGAFSLGVLVIFGTFTVAFASVAGRFGPSLFTTTLSIGTDGVVVERLLRKRFLRRAEIADWVPRAEALFLRLESGEDVQIPASMEAGITVAKRIEEALRSGASPASSLDRLDRGGRPFSAWIAELRGASRGALGYRGAALACQDLADVVKDGAAPAERRIAAAVALSALGEEEARAALRVAADTCVDERLRVVLGHAGELPDEELEEAIARAEARP